MLPFCFVYTRMRYRIYVSRWRMSASMTSIRSDTELADEAVELLGVKSRTEAIHVALREIVALKRFQKLMSKNAGKLLFTGIDE